MASHDPQVRAERQTLAVGCLSFSLGFVAVLTVVVVLFMRFAIPQDGWWALFPFALSVLTFPLMGGTAVTMVTTYVVRRWQYRRGLFRCIACGRPLRGIGILCECSPEAVEAWHRIRRHRRPLLRHHRKRVAHVLLANLCLVPVAVFVASIAPGRGHYPLAMEATLIHAVTCALVGVCGYLLLDILKMFHLARRFRLRMVVFLELFLVWPCVGGLAMTFLMHHR